MRVFGFLVKNLVRVVKFLETTEIIVLKKYIRVVGSEVVTFKLIKKKWKYFGGSFQICHNMVINDYNRNRVPVEFRYCTDIGVEAAKTAILSANWALIIDHLND